LSVVLLFSFDWVVVLMSSPQNYSWLTV